MRHHFRSTYASALLVPRCIFRRKWFYRAIKCFLTVHLLYSYRLTHTLPLALLFERRGSGAERCGDVRWAGGIAWRGWRERGAPPQR